MKFWIKMVVGLVTGVIIGSYIGPDSIALVPLRTVGTIFTRVLNFIVFPLLLFSGIRCVILLRRNRRLFLILVKSLGYFLLMTVIGATIGIVLGEVLKPGVGITIEEFESATVINYPETSSFILEIVPENILRWLQPGYGVLSILFVSFLTGIGILLAKDEADALSSIIISVDNTLHRLNIMILELLPIGVFAHIGYIMGFMTAAMIMPYLKLILVIIAGSFIQIFIVQALLLLFITKINPFTFIHAVLPAGIFGYVSGNRYTAYPALVECMEHNLGSDREVFTFVAGLGTAFSLSGSAVAAGVSTLFVAQVYGLDLSIYLQILIILLITASTLKMDGLPEGGLVLLSVILTQIIKLPAEGYAIILGVASIIFQIETVVNVTGSAAISYIVSYSEDAVSSVSVREFL